MPSCGFAVILGISPSCIVKAGSLPHSDSNQQGEKESTGEAYLMSSPRAASGSSFLLTCHCENLISLPDPSVGEAGKVPSYSVIITEELGEWILWARSSFCHTFSTPEVFILLGFYLYYNVRRGLNFIVSCGPAYLLINPSISYCFVM